ncbi:hypothetical protein QE152_g36153 [Popillia japonica]|uniref:Uncharacterized protein n=1 Tax=Popillia japonica TaxID=7064 RepID=A0AAW1IDP4_POPJA
MYNRPYISETATAYHENLYNTVPARFGNNNILVNHGQHRNVYDSTTTSISGQQPQPPQFNWGTPINNQCNCPQPTQVVTQRHVVPQGVTYTFQPAAQNYALRNFPNQNNCSNQSSLANAFCQPPTTLQQQIALNQLQKQALEAMLLHEQFRQNPFRLQFHMDGQTNTDELRKLPDICLSKKSILSQQNETEPEKLPEQLFPDSVKRKQFVLEPVFEDKSVQYSPSQESVEIQTNPIKHCLCVASRQKHKNKKGSPKRSRQVDEDSSESDGSSSSKSEESEDHSDNAEGGARLP